MTVARTVRNIINPARPVEQQVPVPAASAARPRRLPLLWLAAVALLLLGFGLRLYDLADPPLDFHPTRQLRGAILARAMYYRLLPNPDPALREDALDFANTIEQFEPSFFESIVARTYLLLGGEDLRVPRLYSILFWVIGGLALYLLARRMAGALPALFSLGYYLFLPFAVQASRSFQPDPWMVMWTILAVLCLYRWSETRGWMWALLAGLLAGIAVLVKVMAAYFVAGAAIAMVLHTLGIRRFWRSPQVYAMAALMILPSALFYLVQHPADAGAYFSFWTLSLSGLLLDPAFYVRWLSFVASFMGLSMLLLGVTGMLISPPRSRILLAGLWGGYLLYGLTLPYQIYTHNYYHLQLVPIVALSLAPVAAVLLERVQSQGWLVKALFTGVALVALVFNGWVAYTQLKAENFRNEPAYWQQVGKILPTDGKVLALTQDYGYRLLYYGWRKVTLWPSEGDLNLAALRGNPREFNSYFAEKMQGKAYFLVTAFGQWDRQSELKQALTENYPLLAQGDGYLLFDLLHPLHPTSQ